MSQVRRRTAGLARRGTARGAVLGVVVVAALVGATLGPVSGAVAAPVPGSTASDGPGALSHFDLARKDCVGTATGRASKVWYTVADGVLSDVYEPTVDTTNVESLQFVVTDGSSFTDLQTRDATYTVSTDPTGMLCVVTTTARSGRWTLRTTYGTDPARNTVLISTRLRGTNGQDTAGLHLFARLDPSIGGNGGGGTDNAGADSATTDRRTGALVAGDTNTVTAATNRDYGRPTSLALLGDRPFASSTNGYVGAASDGLTQLDASHRLTRADAAAPSGNVVDTAEVVGHRGRATLALGFGRSTAASVDTAERSLQAGARSAFGSYKAGWQAYDDTLTQPAATLPHLGSANAA